MELSDLEVFRAVVRAGGVTRAALQLHRVQSNVTTRVKKLEDEMGVALFVREGRRMQLSPAGKILLGYAEQFLALAAEARAALRDTRPAGLLRLGIMESTAAVRLPAVLSDLHLRHPDLAVELITGNPQELVTKVLAGELDAAMVYEPANDERLDKRSAFVEELVIVAKAGHAPIRSARDVAERKLLAFHAGCPHRTRLEDWFERTGVWPDRVVEMGSYHAILGCAVAGMGVALMPKSVVDAYAERKRLSVHPLTGRFRSVRTVLVWRKDGPKARVATLAAVLGGKKQVTT
jgi:DNA-binding transcriptional LysR family regulator